MDDFVAVKSTGQPSSPSPTSSTTGTWHHPRDPRRGPAPHHPRQLLLWPPSTRPVRGGRLGRANPAPGLRHLRCWSTSGEEALKRKDPVAVEDYRDKGYSRGVPQLPGLLAGARRVTPNRPGRDAHRAVPTRRRPPCARLLRREEVHPHERRLHPGAPGEEFIERSKPGRTGAGEWTPSTAGPPWPAERFDADTFARLAPLVQERVATLARCPPCRLHLPGDPPTTRPSSTASSCATRGGRHPGRGGAVYSHCEWRAADLHDLTLEMAERLGKKLGKAQAPIRVAVTGRKVGPPLFEALEVLGRDEVLRRLQRPRSARCARRHRATWLMFWLFRWFSGSW